MKTSPPGVLLGVLLHLYPIALSAQVTEPPRLPSGDERRTAQELFSPPARDNVATQSTWGLLSLEAAGIETFWKTRPTSDGRGVIVVILDSGVDPGQEGLVKNSLGHQKLIDIVDFSGTGDVLYTPAIVEGDQVSQNGRTVLTGVNSLKPQAWNNEFFYGFLPEVRFQNGLGDLNFNGLEKDTFGVVIFEDAPGHYAAIVDSDGDKSIADERILFSYHERFDIFGFRSSDSLKDNGKRLYGGVNFYPERNLVSLVFDDGSHGTHVAGIAGGFAINGAEGFNGVAPGCELVGVKFADNSAGGVTVSNSMRQSFLYAAELARRGSKPVVVNMSFGIGSEIEGQSVMDLWLDSLLAVTPNLTVCISGSNDGPGLSNVGLPGSASRVITSGAMLPDDSGRDLFGVDLKRPIIWDFSSRGGELSKPDIVSPGTAVSTVPDFAGGERYNGTSMASPYTAGCVAILLSAMQQQFPNYVVDAHTVKRAIQLSAVSLPGQLPVDQGYGLINVPKAFELLSLWHRQRYVPTFHDISTTIPSAVKKGTAAYFRAGNFPRQGESHAFQVRRIASDKKKGITFEAFDLISDADWMYPIQRTIYERGGDRYDINVAYRSEKLRNPGIYSGRIWAYRKSAAQKYARVLSQFELQSTVVVPYELTSANGYQTEITKIDLSNNQLRRYFFAIPAGAQGLRVTLTSRDGREGTNARIFDHDGRHMHTVALRKGQSSANVYLTGSQLDRGVIEIILKQPFATGDERQSDAELRVEGFVLDAQVHSTTAGTKASAYFTLTNPSMSTLDLGIDGEVLHFERSIDTVIQSGDSFTMPVPVTGLEDAIRYDIVLSRQDYNLFTDITCQIIDSDSAAVVNSAFDLREKSISFGVSPGDSNRYALRFRGGLALPDRPHPFRLRIVERHMLERPVGTRVEPPRTTLSPYESQPFALTSTRDLPNIPPAYRWFGHIRAKHDPDATIKLPIGF